MQWSNRKLFWLKCFGRQTRVTSTNIDLLRILISMQKNSRANFSPKIFKNRKNLNQTSRGGFNAPTTKVQFLSRQVQLNINKFYPYFILRNSTVDPIRYRNQMVQGRGQLQKYIRRVWVSDLLCCGFRWWNSRLQLPNHWTDYFSIRFKIEFIIINLTSHRTIHQ